RMPRAAFSQIVNRSMSEVLTRSLATSFCTLLPVVSLLLFGGETLKDFAFALMVGIASGAYSSIFIASPVLTHWKEREAAYGGGRERIVRDLGAVPAYATLATGAPEDVEPVAKRKRTLRGSLTAPQEPGEQLSRDEFQELVRDLDVDQPAQRSGATARQTEVTRTGVAEPALAPQPEKVAGGPARPPRGPPTGGPRPKAEAQAGRKAQAPAQPPSRQVTLMDPTARRQSRRGGR